MLGVERVRAGRVEDSEDFFLMEWTVNTGSYTSRISLTSARGNTTSSPPVVVLLVAERLQIRLVRVSEGLPSTELAQILPALEDRNRGAFAVLNGKDLDIVAFH